MEHYRRYTGEYNVLSQTLFGNEFKSRDELNDIESALLTNILQSAIENVPYYKNLDIKEANINHFPILSRDDVFDNPKSLVSKQYQISNLLKLHTGGSTGAPLTVYLSKDIRRKTYAFWNRFYRSFGFKIRDKKASFVGRKLQESDDNSPPFWRVNAYDRQVLFSSFHLSKKNIPAYIDKLNQFKPDIVEGYPLSILRIAEYALENNIHFDFKAKGISTSSENVSPKQREVIEKAFKCGVYDQYGSAESVVFAADCQFKNKHISVEYGYVEVLDKEGQLNRTGEGELIITTLINDAMPLIRYRLGDLGRVSHRKCECGRNTPILEELYGKVGAFIQAGDKRVSTAALSIAFEYLKNVKKSQIIQNEANKIIVKLIATDEFDLEEENFMVWELKKMLTSDLEIEIQKVDAIPPAAKLGTGNLPVSDTWITKSNGAPIFFDSATS